MRGYLSFFPIMAVVVMGMLLTQAYFLGASLSEEGENTLILADRLYYIRKGAEGSYWAGRGNFTKNWEKSISGTAPALTLPFSGYATAEEAFSGKLTKKGQIHGFTTRTPSGRECLSPRGPSGAAFIIENPRAATVFLAWPNQTFCPKG